MALNFYFKSVVAVCEAPSGMFFNARYSKLHIGNFVDERFKDVFKSERYWKIMNYLAS